MGDKPWLKHPKCDEHGHMNLAHKSEAMNIYYCDACSSQQIKIKPCSKCGHSPDMGFKQ